MRARPAVLGAALAALLGAAAAGALLLGPTDVPFGDALRALAGLGGAPDGVRDVVVGIRLPRLFLGAAVGASLALSGAIVQGLFSNPLAEPYLLGISSGAALAAAIALLAGASAAFGVPLAAIAGGAAALAASAAAAETAGTLPRDRLLLAGVMVNAAAGAALLLLLVLFPASLHGLLFWLVGSLALADPGAATVVAAPLAAALLLSRPAARALDALALGDEEAAHLGVEPARARRLLFLLAAALAAVPVAFAGMIGFVGLVVPHLVRSATGPVHRRLLLPAAAAGAASLVLADTLARTALAPVEVPVGVVTAAVGAPFFLWLLRRER